MKRLRPWICRTARTGPTSPRAARHLRPTLLLVGCAAARVRVCACTCIRVRVCVYARGRASAAGARMARLLQHARRVRLHDTCRGGVKRQTRRVRLLASAVTRKDSRGCPNEGALIRRDSRASRATPTESRGPHASVRDEARTRTPATLHRRVWDTPHQSGCAPSESQPSESQPSESQPSESQPSL